MTTREEKGSALIFSYGIVMVLTLLGAGLMSRNFSETIMVRRFDYANRAFWLAEAGLHRSVYELNYGGGNWTGWSGTDPKTFQASVSGSGDFDISIAGPSGSAPEITSTGYYPSRTASDKVERVVNAVLTRSGNIFSYAAFGLSSVTISGNGNTDSYDSSLGAYGGGNVALDGDVGTNGDITGNGTSYSIGGDAITGPDGSYEEDARVEGEISHVSNVCLAPVSVPAALSSLVSGGTISSDQTLSSGDYKFTAIDLSASETVTINGPANIYLTGVTSIDLSGSSSIVVNNGDVVFYVDGSVDASGNGISNTTSQPSDLLIYGTSTCDSISFTGNSAFFGAVYAPAATLGLTGNGALYGSFLGNTVTISGNGGVHYDETLSDLDTSQGKYSVRSWKENQNPRPVS